MTFYGTVKDTKAPLLLGMPGMEELQLQLDGTTRQWRYAVKPQEITLTSARHFSKLLRTGPGFTEMQKTSMKS